MKRSVHFCALLCFFTLLFSLSTGSQPNPKGNRQLSHWQTGQQSRPESSYGDESKMYVHSICLCIDSNWSNQAAAAVTVLDQDGGPVPGAVVRGRFSGGYNGTFQACTDNSGTAQIVSDGNWWWVEKFDFCVTGVTAASMAYTAAKNKMTCIHN